MKRDAELHELRCRQEVADCQTVRRLRGRWQAWDGEYWRFIDPLVKFPEREELKVLP